MTLENTDLETSTSSKEGSNHNLNPERSLAHAADGQLEHLKTDSTSGNTGDTSYVSADAEHPTGDELQRQKTLADSIFRSVKSTAEALKSNPETWNFHPSVIPQERVSQVVKYLSGNPKSADGARYEKAWRDEVHAEVTRVEDAKADAHITNAADNGKVLGVYCGPTGKFTLEIEKANGERHYGVFPWNEAQAALIHHGELTDDVKGILINAKESRSRFLGELVIAGKQEGIMQAEGGNPERADSFPKFYSPRGPALSAVEGDHSFYSENIKSLCGGDPRLYNRIFLTVHRALTALGSGSWEMFPILILEGMEGIGKSLFCSLLARACGAYDAGKAGPYLLGGDGGAENKELVGSLVWDANDLVPPSKIDGVRKFHSFLKSCHADEYLLLKGLYSDKVRVNPLRLIVIGMNEDNLSSKLIPPLDDRSGFKKKVIAWRANRMSHLIADRKLSSQALVKQAPAFRHWIMNGWYNVEFQAHLDLVSDERVGVLHYCDPELADDAIAQSHEADAFGKICDELNVGPGCYWVGSWSELSKEVSEIVKSARYLSSLRRVLPHLVQCVKPASKKLPTLWVIREGSHALLDTELPWDGILKVDEAYTRISHLYSRYTERRFLCTDTPSDNQFSMGVGNE